MKEGRRTKEIPENSYKIRAFAVRLVLAIYGVNGLWARCRQGIVRPRAS